MYKIIKNWIIHSCGKKKQLKTILIFSTQSLDFVKILDKLQP